MTSKFDQRNKHLFYSNVFNIIFSAYLFLYFYIYRFAKFTLFFVRFWFLFYFIIFLFFSKTWLTICVHAQSSGTFSHIYFTKNVGRLNGNWIHVCRKKYTVREEREGYKVWMYLIIKQFTEEDVGHYKCISTNSLGKVERSLRLYGKD